MKRAIVTGGNRNVVDPMGVLAVNISKVIPEYADELIIFHDGISGDVQAKFNKVMPTRFIKYNCPVSKLKLLLNPVIRHFSPMVFCKIECFRLLEEYDEVTWIDYDMLIKTDISSLKEHENTYNLLLDSDVPFKEMLRPGYERLHLDTKYNLNHPSMVAALFHLKKDSEIDYNNWCDWYYDKLQRFSKYLYLPEQVLITLMIQEFDISYDVIDPVIYNRFPTDDSESAKILHCYGSNKFWNGLNNDMWNEYYEEWKKS